jgi:hypothetical protein
LLWLHTLHACRVHVALISAAAAADEVDKRNPKPPSAARAVYHGRSEVRAALTVATGGFGDKSMTLEEKATKATGASVHTTPGCILCVMHFTPCIALVHACSKP